MRLHVDKSTAKMNTFNDKYRLISAKLAVYHGRKTEQKMYKIKK